MVDTPKTIMTAYDWQMFGVQNFDGQLPMRRLQLPLPPQREGLFKLSHDLYGLAEKIRTTAQQAGTARHAILDLEFLIGQQNRIWQRLREDWERELPENQDKQSEIDGKVEQIRPIRGT